MKFIHTSDWHIGRQFHNVSLLEDQRHVLNQLIEHIQREAVEAVVIAGDIYDRSVPPAAAVSLLDDVLHQICNQLHIPVILIPGNHDSAERLRFGSRQFSQAGLHIIGDLKQIETPIRIHGKTLAVDFYGIPYTDPETVRNQWNVSLTNHEDAHRYLLERIQEVQSSDARNVLISHCFIDGCDASDSERPLSIGGADRISYNIFSGFDYVALGHLHGPQHKGESHIRYSGSILKYSFSEQKQRKGATLVEMTANGMGSATHLPLTPLRDMRILEGELKTLLEQGKTDPNVEDYLLVRLTDPHALLDPMGQLREVYPNVLHLEKPGMLGRIDEPVQRARLQRNELDMFRDFFTQVQGQDLSNEQEQAVQTVIKAIHHIED